MRDTALRFACASLLSCALAGGCGGTGTATPVCEPSCPARTHCTLEGCVPDQPGEEDMTTPASKPDLAGCNPTCAGNTPYCLAGRCVPCLADENCPIGQICKMVGGGATCAPGCPDDARCGGGNMKCCNQSCIDTSKDTQNCGGCGTVCTGQHTSALCQGGKCVTGACAAGWGDCNNDGQDGCETNLRIDAMHCTACGMKCDIKNAVAACSGSSMPPCYIAACRFGFDDCNGDPKDGCETSVLSDAKNCGGCGMPCVAVPHAKVTCQNASCALTSCDLGYADCDGKPANGCEVTVATDVSNCGACGNKCAQGLACINGSCTCNNCNLPNAKTKCVNLQCLFDSCVAGFGDCDNNPANGCEKDLRFDNANCNACGAACPQGKFCVNGVCGAQQLPCSMIALQWCMQKGFTVPQGGQAAGGRLYCTKNVSTGNDCNTCNDYNMIVWTNGAKPLYCMNFNYSTQAGRVYAGHNPCQCGDNLIDCGAWDMMGCMPD